MSWKISPVKSGQTIGLWTPASSVKPEQVQNGLAQLKARGFNYRLGAHAFSHNGITAASPAARLSDLHGFLRDPQISAIWALRGGYGTAQMLNQIDYDLLQKHPKLLIGFSDVTALEWGIFAQTGIPTFSGLTITTQFSDENPYLDTALRMLSGEKNAIDESDLPQGTPVIHRKGSAEGLLIGGTLSMICSLYGTPYFPESENLILFIEDVDEPLYRIDRLLGMDKSLRHIILLDESTGCSGNCISADFGSGFLPLFWENLFSANNFWKYLTSSNPCCPLEFRLSAVSRMDILHPVYRCRLVFRQASMHHLSGWNGSRFCNRLLPDQEAFW